MRKQLYVCLISFLVISVSVKAESCKSYNEKLDGHAGSVSMSGDICLKNNSYADTTSGTISVNYDNYSADGAFTRNGSLILTYVSNSISPAPTSLTLTYNGGPVSYDIAGQIYSVEFQNLSYTFDGKMTQLSASGQVLLNGVALPAENTPYSYVKTF